MAEILETDIISSTEGLMMKLNEIQTMRSEVYQERHALILKVLDNSYATRDDKLKYKQLTDIYSVSNTLIRFKKNREKTN